MKITKLKKRRRSYSEKNPTKLSCTMGGESDKKVSYQKRKKSKLQWPMSAKSDTQLPGFIYNEIGILLGPL